MCAKKGGHEVAMPDPKNKLGLMPNFDKPKTTDPAYGQAPVPPEDQHVIIGGGLKIPDHIQAAEDDDIIQHLIEDGEGVVAELQGGAMHDRLQQIISHFRHVLAEARDRFLVPKPAAESEKGSVVPALLTALALIMLFLFWLPSRAQKLSDFTPQNNAAASAVGPGGAITNPTGNDIAISPGPVFCNGGLSYIHSTKFTLTGPPAIPAVASQSGASQLFYVFYSCAQDQVVLSVFPPPLASAVSLGTVLQSNSAGSLSYTITDVRAAFQFPNASDETFWVPETACSGATSGTAGSGNATDILAGSGGVRVFRLSATNASSSANTFTCVFTVPTKLTSGKGFSITDITILVSTQTTQPTSVTLPTVKQFTVPAAVDPETANSATFTAYCGTITQAPTSAQFAAYTPVSAGQFFSIKATCGTPVFLNTDLQMVQYVIVFNQSASAASLQEVAGLVVHGVRVPL